MKHAKATSVSISLTQGDNMVCLEVADNGVGFDPVQAIGVGGLGLCSMQERAEGIGAELEIISQVGSGSKVVVRRPTS
jgi:signal transduction histidine kinase